MSAYLIVRVEITDPERYREYMRHSPAAIAKYGGRFLARGGESLTLEGDKQPGRVVLVEFPNLEQAKAFYDSPEYQAAKKLREGAASGHFVAVAGVDS